MSSGRSTARAVAWSIVVLALGGCTSSVRVPLAPFYVSQGVDPERVEVRLDVPYREGTGADPAKHRLDLYLPREGHWPLLAFVHGGSLERGDTSLSVGGNEVYRNIGRFFASRGVAVALINYRLQPRVSWPEQVDDVAAATAWLVAHGPELGGDGRLVLSGHSAGAWLAAHVAFDDAVRERHGIEARNLDAVISVSGSGFDLTDERTWEMFGSRRKWRRRFSVAGHEADWQEHASLVPRIDGDPLPPVLLLYSSREWRALERQNRLFCQALDAAGHRCTIEKVHGLGHRRMVLALSRPDGAPAVRILEKLRGAAAGARPATP